MRNLLIILSTLILLTLSSCIKDKDGKNKRGDTYYHNFQWDYDGHHFQMELSFQIATYDYYEVMPKNAAYNSYACEDASHPYLQYMATNLKNLAAPYNFDQKQMAEYVMAFAQSVPYTPDPVGKYDYVPYPILSLMDFRGDCEDKALIAVAALSQFGYNTALLGTMHHMAAGIEIPGYTYEGYDGTKGHHYVYSECAGPGYVCGQNPFPDEKVIEIYEVKPILKPLVATKTNVVTTTQINNIVTPNPNIIDEPLAYFLEIFWKIMKP